jgi:isoamylase
MSGFTLAGIARSAGQKIAKLRTELTEFARSVVAIRAAHPVFPRRRFFDGIPLRRRDREGTPDISWFRTDGTEMSDQDWDSGFGKAVAVYLNGAGIPGMDSRGQRVTDDSFVLIFNAHHEPLDFVLPPKEFGANGSPVLDSAVDTRAVDQNRPFAAQATATIEARSVVVLQAVPDLPA